jgi:dual specificity MAP kinase phosphatase
MTLPSTHPLRLITDNLQKLGIQVQFLLGGLKAFHAAYPELCSKPSKPLSPPFIFSPTTPVVEMDVDSAEIAEIAPHVFLGNERDASNRELLNKYSINHVLNVTSNIPTHFDTDSSMSYKRLQASDSGCQNLKQYFGEAIAFIESARTQGGRVLVHCQAGVSRSATIVIAYLMARYDWTMMAAFHYVKSRRSIIAPNFNFMGQLLEFEQACQDGLAKRYLDDQTPSATPSLGLQVAMDCGPSSI